MAEQAFVQARVDKELKQEVAEKYEALGMDLTLFNNTPPYEKWRFLLCIAQTMY